MDGNRFDFASLPAELRVLIYKACLDTEQHRGEPLEFGVAHLENSSIVIGPLLGIVYAFKGFFAEPVVEIMRYAQKDLPSQSSGHCRIVLTNKPLPALRAFNHRDIVEAIHQKDVLEAIREVKVLSHMEPGSGVNPQDWLTGVTLCRNLSTLDLVFKPRAVMGKWKPMGTNKRPAGALPPLHDRVAEYHVRKLSRCVGMFKTLGSMMLDVQYEDVKVFREYQTLVQEYGADFETKPEFRNPNNEYEFYLMTAEEVVKHFRLHQVLQCERVKRVRLICPSRQEYYDGFGDGPLWYDQGKVADVMWSGFHGLVKKVAVWLQNEFATRNGQWVFVQVCEENRRVPNISS